MAERSDNAAFVPNDLERVTKHVFRVNLAQIRSAVPEIFHTQTYKQKPQTDGATNRTVRSLLRAVINRMHVMVNSRHQPLSVTWSKNVTLVLSHSNYSNQGWARDVSGRDRDETETRRLQVSRR